MLPFLPEDPGRCWQQFLLLSLTTEQRPFSSGPLSPLWRQGKVGRAISNILELHLVEAKLQTVGCKGEESTAQLYCSGKAKQEDIFPQRPVILFHSRVEGPQRSLARQACPVSTGPRRVLPHVCGFILRVNASYCMWRHISGVSSLLPLCGLQELIQTLRPMPRSAEKSWRSLYGYLLKAFSWPCLGYFIFCML